MSVLDKIREVIQVPIKLIHVIRNPFDNIATMMLHAVKSRDAVRGGGLKVRASLLHFNSTKPDERIDKRSGVLYLTPKRHHLIESLTPESIGAVVLFYILLNWPSVG